MLSVAYISSPAIQMTFCNISLRDALISRVPTKISPCKISDVSGNMAFTVGKIIITLQTISKVRRQKSYIIQLTGW